tara:strand:+ start:125 stop:433 length:309 start_codon:yes stop_codon:yes gene_type:complete
MTWQDTIKKNELDNIDLLMGKLKQAKEVIDQIEKVLQDEWTSKSIKSITILKKKAIKSLEEVSESQLKDLHATWMTTYMTGTDSKMPANSKLVGHFSANRRW